MEHLLLLIQYKDGKPLKEPVHVERLANGTFRLLYSPGFVQGISADDEFRLLDDDGAFEVTHRSGNLTVQVYAPEPVLPYRDELTRQVEQVSGRLDGGIGKGLVFTFPCKVTFAQIERVLDAWVTVHTGWEWYFGNVYDPKDGVTPLNWWK